MKPHWCFARLGRVSLVAFVFVTMHTHIAMAAKDEIWGIRPGMTVVEYQASLNKIIDQDFANGAHDVRGYIRWVLRRLAKYEDFSCSASVKEPVARSAVSCTREDGELTVKFSSFLKPARVVNVSLTFTSDPNIRKVIDGLSSQYGIAPKQSDDEAGSVSRTLSLYGLRSRVAEWHLNDDMILELKGAETYELVLTSKAVDRSDDAAAQAMEQTSKTIPKF